MKTADGVRDTINQDGAVLLDIEQGLCFSINPIGARIWQLLKEGKSQENIIDTLAVECEGVSRAQLVTDVAEFIADLRAKNLLCNETPKSLKKHNVLSRLFARCKSA